MIGTAAGRRGAAIEMTIYLTIGALLSLLGLISLYAQSGADSFSLLELRNYLTAQPLSETVQSNIFALLLFGFGILVSLFPFHSWAAKGYAVAPTGAAMLHAGVLKKFLRFASDRRTAAPEWCRSLVLVDRLVGSW